MTLLRRLFGGKVYQIVLAVLLFATLLYQAETGLLPQWPVPSDTPQDSAGRGIDEVRVTRVIDGDTFEIESGERVRLIGVDAPESVKPDTPIECYALESSEYLEGLIEGKTVGLERDRTDRDRYARLLRYVYLDGIFINEKIVREGYAESVGYKPDTAKQAVLDQAEEKAKSEQRGRWTVGVCQ